MATCGVEVGEREQERVALSVDLLEVDLFAGSDLVGAGFGGAGCQRLGR